MSQSYSVGQLSNILKACFDNPSFSHLKVYGEVYSIKLGKFSYIEIGDQGSKQANSPLLKCAFSCFYGNDYSLEEIKVGDVIEIEGKLSYYPHGSSITLWGESVEILKSQEGKNLLAKKKTLEKLDKLGYLDEKRKRKIPSFCKRIAILTAENGAAYQDILKTLHGRFPLSTVLYPCVVQGENAASSMTKALLACQKEDFDCILLGRGGGSKTDLSCFDDEKLSLAIAESKIPVITCIGHTIDTAIADRVSDVKAITPTEGASLINKSKEQINDEREDFLASLNKNMREIITSHYMFLSQFYERLQAYSPKNKLDQKHKENDDLLSKLNLSYKNLLASKENQIKNFLSEIEHNYRYILNEKKLKLSNFLSILEKDNPTLLSKNGISYIYKNGKKVTSIREIDLNDEIIVTYPDGRIKAKVTERNLNGN